ncbi:MAG: DUF4905 domain-containing protein [Cyclobacteriaceae bacterium]
MLEHEALAFSFDVEGKIWKMAFDNTTSNLVLELRLEESYDVSYLVFNFQTLEISEYLHFEQADWWVSLVEISGNFLFVDKYNDPQNPVNKSMLILDWKVQRLTNQIDDFQMHEIRENVVLGTSIKDKDEIIKIDLEGILPNSSNRIEYPSFYGIDHQYFKLVCDLLKRGDIVLGVEYMDNATSLAISYYLREEKSYARYLLVMKNDDEIYHKVIDQRIDGRALGSFFVIDQKLLFIKDQTQLNAIDF